MVRARFAITGQLVDAKVTFVVDTGADTTILSAADARRLAVNYEELADPTLISSIGGPVAAFPSPAAIILEGDEVGPCLFRVNAVVLSQETTRLSDDTPSLLGRDVLDRVRMVYHRRGDGLLIEPTEPDAVV